MQLNIVKEITIKYVVLLYYKLYCLFQIILLEESWRDIFLLGLAQWNVPLEVQNILDCASIAQEKLSSDKMAAILSDIRYIRDVVSRMRQFTVDSTEYACLKAVAIFRPGE